MLLRTAFHTSHHVIREAPHAIFPKTEGWCKLSDVALSCFEMIAYFSDRLSKFQMVLSPKLRNMVHLGTIVQLIKRVSDWNSLEREDSHLFARIAFLSTLTTGYFMNFVSWLNRLGLITLGKALLNVERSVDISFTACCVFDLWLSHCSLKENAVEREKVMKISRGWSARQKQGFEKSMAEIQKVKVAEGSKKNRWISAISKCKGEASYQRLCAKKMRKWNEKLADLKLADIKTWTSIAYDVAVIAGAMLSIVLPLMGISTALCLAVTPLVCTVIDLHCYILDNARRIPPFLMPTR